jgi:hypothetical protein
VAQAQELLTGPACRQPNGARLTRRWAKRPRRTPRPDTTIVFTPDIMLPLRGLGRPKRKRRTGSRNGDKAEALGDRAAERLLARQLQAPRPREGALGRQGSRQLDGATRAKAVVRRRDRGRLPLGDCDNAPRLLNRQFLASTITSCVGIDHTESRRALGYRAIAWPREAVISSLPAHALLQLPDRPGRIAAPRPS